MLQASFHTVTVSKDNLRWGLLWWENESEPNAVRVRSILPEGAFWQLRKTVLIGDYIISVNGVPNAQEVDDRAFEQILQEFQKSTEVTLKLARFESAFTRKFNRSPGLDFGLQLDDAGYITGIDVDSVIDSDNEVI